MNIYIPVLCLLNLMVIQVFGDKMLTEPEILFNFYMTVTKFDVLFCYVHHGRSSVDKKSFHAIIEL
jgi:hypothetical protein